MPIVLALNPGSNSLKFDIAEVHPGQRFASDGNKLFTGAIDNIGKEAAWELIRAKKTQNRTPERRSRRQQTHRQKATMQ